MPTGLDQVEPATQGCQHNDRKDSACQQHQQHHQEPTSQEMWRDLVTDDSQPKRGGPEITQ